MRIALLRRNGLTAVLAFLLGCNPSTPTPLDGQKDHTWRSEHHPVEVRLGDGWKTTLHVNRPGDTCDEPEKLVAGFANRDAGMSYLLKMEKDVPLEQLSMDDYLAVIKRELAADPGLALESEDTVALHGKEFRRLRVRVASEQGPRVMESHFYRNGKRSIAIQWRFLVSAHGSLETPDSIKEFDRSVRIGDEVAPAADEDRSDDGAKGSDAESTGQ